MLFLMLRLQFAGIYFDMTLFSQWKAYPWFCVTGTLDLLNNRLDDTGSGIFGGDEFQNGRNDLPKSSKS